MGAHREGILFADRSVCSGDSGRRSIASGHRILGLSRRVGVDRHRHGKCIRPYKGILRAINDEARRRMHSGWSGGEDRGNAFSDIGLILPIEWDILGCRRRMHLQRTIVRLLYRHDGMPRSTGRSAQAMGAIVARQDTLPYWRESDVAYGSKPEMLAASKCLLLFIQ